MTTRGPSEREVEAVRDAIVRALDNDVLPPLSPQEGEDAAHAAIAELLRLGWRAPEEG